MMEDQKNMQGQGQMCKDGACKSGSCGGGCGCGSRCGFNSSCGSGCGCSSGCGGCCSWGGRKRLVRWALGLIIIAIVFWLGVAVGTIRTMLRGEFDGYWGMSRYHGYYPMMMGYPTMQDMPMMQQQGVQTPSTPSK